MKRAMHDPKFEQEVQRRMHDLEFVPSESVWAGIQQGIAPRERRRAVAIFWWLFPGMLLLAGGIVMYRHSASTNGVAAVVPAAGTVKPAGGAGSAPGSGTGGVGQGVAANGAGGAGDGVVSSRIRNRVGQAPDESGAQGNRSGQLTAGAIAEIAVSGGEEGAIVARRA